MGKTTAGEKAQKEQTLYRLKLVVYVLALVSGSIGLVKLLSTKSSGGNTAETHGKNSPALAGNTTGNITFDYSTKFNIAVTPEQLRTLIDSKAETAKPDFEKRYPEGYVLFGKAGDQVIYKPSAGTVKLSADWDKTEILHDVRRRLILVQIFESVLTWGGSRMRIGELTSTLPFEEGKPIRIQAYSIGGISMYCEIVDIKNGVFLIGQRKEQGANPQHPSSRTN